MRTLLTIVVFIGLLAIADLLANNGNLVGPILKLIARSIG